MVSRFAHPKSVNQLVEDHMRQWELGKTAAARSELRSRTGKQIDYITISRDLGSGGEEVAASLSELLGWQVYDKEILNYMAEDLHVQEQLIRSIDEGTTNWVEESLAAIVGPENYVGQFRYYSHLTRVLLVISRHGRAIIVGRAAGLVLPREHGLSIRVTAPVVLRAQAVARDEGISFEQARKQVEKSDQTQRRFVKEYAHKDFQDCSNFDLVFSIEKLSPQSVAKLIWRALDQRHQNA